MAKTKKRRRNQVFSDSKRQNGEHTACVEPVGADLSESGIDSSTETISELDLRTTMMKELRVAVNPLVEERMKQTAGAGLATAGMASLSGKVSTALNEERWEDAVTLLETMRKPREVPKLGAVQRWVRECDLGATYADNPEVLRVLDAIMRTCGQVWGGIAAAEHAAGEAEAEQGFAQLVPQSGKVRVYPAWQPVPKRPLPEPAPPLFSRSNMRVVGFEVGEDRRPSNRHDLQIWATTPASAITFDEVHGTARHDFPYVPGAFFLSNVLSDGECAQIIAASESMGYTPDEPLDKPPDARAVGCVWLVDDSILAPIYSRVAPLLPQQLGGGHIAGLNARWRLYRYSPGNIYRPHVDGAWPGSGLDEQDRYVYDAFGDRWSKLTFVIYLTDDFEGGSTTFFCPARVTGCLEARGVNPSRGSVSPLSTTQSAPCDAKIPIHPLFHQVMVFPHGDAMGALVHEGSAVLRGCKYIVRTDVLYKGAEAEADTGGVDNNKKHQRHMKVNSNDRWTLNKGK